MHWITIGLPMYLKLATMNKRGRSIVPVTELPERAD